MTVATMAISIAMVPIAIAALEIEK